MKRSQRHNWKHTDAPVYKGRWGRWVGGWAGGWVAAVMPWQRQNTACRPADLSLAPTVCLLILIPWPPCQENTNEGSMLIVTTCVFVSKSFVQIKLIIKKKKMKPSDLILCDVSSKVKESGTGTLTTTAWMAPQTPPPGKSGPRSSTTPATSGRTWDDEMYEMNTKLSPPALSHFFPRLRHSPPEDVCSSFPPAPARWASTWWPPTGSSSSMPPGTPPTTFRVSSGSTALASWRRSLCTGSSHRWAWRQSWCTD